MSDGTGYYVSTQDIKSVLATMVTEYLIPAELAERVKEKVLHEQVYLEVK